MVTTLHYGDGLDTPRNKAFRLAYAKAYKLQPDVYAVQGYDAGQLLAHGRQRGQGRHRATSRRCYKAMEGAKIDSPRGTFTLSKAHNPVQDIYLRKVVGKENKVIGVAAKALADSGARLQDGLKPDQTALAELQARQPADVLPPFFLSPLHGSRHLPHPVLNGVQYGLLLFLVAAGLTLIFGIMGVINLAHGSFYMIGAYLAFSLAQPVRQPVAGHPACGVVLAVLLGMALEWLLFRHLYQRDHLHQVLLTYGLILVFEELRSLLWGDDVHGVPVPDLLGALDSADREPVLPGLPPVHLRRLPGAGAGPVPADPAARGWA